MAQPGAAHSEYVHDCSPTPLLPGLGQPTYLLTYLPPTCLLLTYHLPTYQASVNLTLELSTNGQHHARTAAGFTFEYYAPDSNPNPNP